MSNPSAISFLIVDDDEIDRMVLKRMINKCDFASCITEVTNGNSALEYLVENSNAEEAISSQVRGGVS